jgi:hypothetical protein
MPILILQEVTSQHKYLSLSGISSKTYYGFYITRFQQTLNSFDFFIRHGVYLSSQFKLALPFHQFG